MLNIDRLKELANERNMSIQALEAKAELANGTIGKWKDSSPRVSSLMKVAEALEMSTSALIIELGGN